MSRLENHAMLRDAATDVFNLQALMVIGPAIAANNGL